MAELLPEPPAPPGGPWRRDWHSYDGYRLAHYNQMAALQDEGIVVDDELSFTETSFRSELVGVYLTGTVKTRREAILMVDKWLEVGRRNNRVVVRTREYSYQALVGTGRLKRKLFRYDNSHPLPRGIHRHYFDVDGNERPGPPTEIDPEWMPLLSQVIRQADWLADYTRTRQGDSGRSSRS